MDPGDLASLFYSDDESAPARTAALAQALRGQSQMGMLGVLSGDKVLGGLGQQLLSSAGQREQALAMAPGQRLKMALEKQNLTKGKTEMDEATAPASPIYNQLATKFGFQLPGGMTNQQAREALGLAEKAYAADMRAKELNLNRAATRDAKEAAKTTHEEDRVEADTQGLSKRMENAPGMARDIGTLARAAKEEDIPGVGPIVGHLPDWMVSGEGLKVRQAARGVVRNVIHETSGTAASEGEVDRILGELGMKQSAGEDAYRLGLEGLAAKTKSLLKAKEAGYRPEAVKLARQRGMTTSTEIPEYRAPGDAPKATKTTARRVAMPDGSVWEEQPDGSAKRVR